MSINTNDGMTALEEKNENENKIFHTRSCIQLIVIINYISLISSLFFFPKSILNFKFKVTRFKRKSIA